MQFLMAHIQGTDKYITFNLVDDRAAYFGDDEPITDVQLFQVHFFRTERI